MRRGTFQARFRHGIQGCKVDDGLATCPPQRFVAKAGDKTAEAGKPARHRHIGHRQVLRKAREHGFWRAIVARQDVKRARARLKMYHHATRLRSTEADDWQRVVSERLNSRGCLKSRAFHPSRRRLDAPANTGGTRLAIAADQPMSGFCISCTAVSRKACKSAIALSISERCFSSASSWRSASRSQASSCGRSPFLP